MQKQFALKWKYTKVYSAGFAHNSKVLGPGAVVDPHVVYV